ncbi:hypothetical protein D3C85_584570 [compost metagenome]
MSKKQVVDSVSTKFGSSFDGTLKELVSKIDELVGEFGENAKVEFYGLDGYVEVEVTTYRMETDEEYSRRIERESKETARKEAKEKAELERLMKKYGETK